jgi:hypothetical protein
MKIHKDWAQLRSQAQIRVGEIHTGLHKRHGLGFDRSTFILLVDLEMNFLRDLTRPSSRDLWVRWLEQDPERMYSAEAVSEYRNNPELLLEQLCSVSLDLGRLHARQERIKTKMEERKHGTDR